jgi:membrane protease YdiL (CAAX protease family)
MTIGRALGRPVTAPAVRSVAVGALLLVAAVALAARPSVVATSAATPAVRTAALAALYLAIAAASLLPATHRDRAILPAPVTALLGIAAVTVAWSTAAPTAPVAVAAASIPLSTAAAVAEEALFRRLAYGELRRFGAPVAIVATAAVFAAVHVPAYGLAALPVDLGAGLLFGWQRWACGSWTASAATHVAANLLAVIR